MRRNEFSEFSYGFAVTEEMIHGWGSRLTAVPYFPTLREEARIGFDVRLDRNGIPLFLQFKISEGMTSRRARECQLGLPMGTPFYRMHLHRMDRSNQHQALLTLEQTGEEVYYVAPRFNRQTEFSLAYFQRRVIARSAFIRPGDIGRILDNQSHWVAFDQMGRRGWRFSEPVEVETILSGSELAEMLEGKLFPVADLPPAPTLEEYAQPLYEKVRNIAGETGRRLTADWPYKAGGEGPHEFLSQVALLARAYFGCQFVIAQPAQEA